MIGRKSKQPQRVDSSRHYIYYDSSMSNLRKKISINVFILNFRQTKLMVVVDTTSKEDIVTKILDNLESFTELVDVGRKNLDNFYIINSEDKKLSLQSDADFALNLSEGSNLYCEIMTSHVWVETWVNIHSSIKTLNLSFDMRVNLKHCLKMLKLILLKRVLYEWGSSNTKDKLPQLHYVISETKMEISSSENNSCLNKMINIHANEEELNKVFVQHILDYKTTISVYIEMASIEILVLQKLQKSILEKSYLEKLEKSALHFTKVSWKEFLYSKKYEKECCLIKNAIQTFARKSSIKSIADDKLDLSPFEFFQFLQIDGKHLKDTLIEECYNHRQTIISEFDDMDVSRVTIGTRCNGGSEKQKERKSLSKDNLPKINYCKPERKSIEQLSILKVLVVLPNNIINSSNKTSTRFLMKSTDGHEPLTFKPKVVRHKSFVNTNLLKVSLDSPTRNHPNENPSSIREEVILYNDIESLSGASQSLNNLINTILENLIKIDEIIIEDNDYFCIENSLDEYQMIEIRKFRVDVNEDSIEKQLYYKPNDEPLQPNNTRILIVISTFLIIYLILSGVLLYAKI